MADELSGWASLDSAIDKLRALPPERQALILQGIPAQKKRAIQFRLNEKASAKKQAGTLLDKEGKPLGLVGRTENAISGMRNFVQETAASEGKKAQESQERASSQDVWQGGKYTGQRPLLVQAGNALLSLGHESANVVNQMFAGVLDPKNMAALLVSKLSPAASAAFFASQGGKDAYEAISKGDKSPENVQRFLLALATVSGSVGAAGEGAPAEAARVNQATAAVKNAPELVRQGSQILAGVGPERTTAPMVEEFNKASNKSTEARAINEGSQKVGEGVEKLRQKIKAEEIDPKYDKIRDAVKDDPGAPAGELTEAVRHAETSILKGSPESIKQFRALASQGEGVTMNGQAVGPNDVAPDIWDQLQKAAGGDTVKFDQLQGFSSELGMKLAQGNLPGDVYQAVKYVKEKIDAAKVAVAERNGVGPALKEADAGYRQYMSTFYDKSSAVAGVRSRVSKLDPEHHATPLITGKAAKVGTEMLRKYDPELAKRVEGLREKQGDFTEMEGKGGKNPATVRNPKAPTGEDVVARKKGELSKEARNLGNLSRFDVGILASSAIAPIITAVMGGGWERMAAEGLAGPAVVAGRRAFSQVLQKPKVMEWLAKPSEEDLRILSTVNPDVQAKVKANIRDFIRNEESHGAEVNVAPSVRNWLRISGTKLVKRGQEILKGEEGSATIPGTGADLDARLKNVNSTIDAEGDTAAFRQAQTELGSDAKASAVMRKAQDIKLSKGKAQGLSENRPGKPTLGDTPMRDPQLAEEVRKQRGRASEVQKKYPVSGTDIPGLRRRLGKLKQMKEEYLASGSPKVDEVNDEIEAIEAELAKK
jgi:hypothetical protein